MIIASTGKAAKVIASKANQKATTIHRVIYSYDDTNEEPVGEDIHQVLVSADIKPPLFAA